MRRAPFSKIAIVLLTLTVLAPAVALASNPVPSFTVAWTVAEDPGTGFEGSPTYCDLDGDGLDEAIVAVGSGAAPFPADPAYVEAIDALTGTRLWRSAQGDAGFAAPLCRDVDHDGVLDVLTAGRFGDVRALSGIDGTVIWSLNGLNPGEIDADANTYSPVSAPERPGLVFVSTGGGVELEDGPRNPGAVLALDLDGHVLARWDEPNQAEIYSTPAVKALGHYGRDILLVVGSGGETLPGSLHFLLYSTYFKTFFPYAEVPSACANGGFVASPVLGDITGDRFGIPEVVAAEMCGTVAAYNLFGHELWRQPTAWPYVIANPTLSDLNQDGVFDVAVASIAVNPSLPATFPLIDASLETFDGATGASIWTAPLKLPPFATPAAADIDGDGIEDLWIATQNFFLPSELTVYSGADGSELVAYGTVSWAGSPVLGDANGDGSIDALVMDAPPVFAPPFPPVSTILLDLPGIPFDPHASWSGFRGPNSDGFRR
ncbi:MAG: PQQ-binding-like beta-propeller repeat protein [Thermoanaerobaculia bacterium]|nr:PQQ-binding-like beta-propeller repeat protein [Thermoanaerobaculia bacterium]